MISLVQGLITTAISLGIIVGNKDDIESFFNEVMNETRRVTTAGDIRTISTMLDYQYIRKGRYPSESQFPRWLLESSKENNVRNIVNDTWGNPFIYTTTKRNKSFTLISTGQDGIYNTDDDMSVTGP